MSEDTDDFASMFAEFEKADKNSTGSTKSKISVGQEVTGTVVSIGAENVFVDLGAKSEGVLERAQICSPDGELLVKVGDSVTARVVNDGERSGSIVLRRGVSKGGDAALAFSQAYQSRIPVDGVVSAVNKGGFEITVAGQRGFCPISQIDDQYVEEPETFVGKKFQFLITKLETDGPRGANIVLSRRALLNADKERKASVTRESLEPGAVLRGRVVSLKPYGAFVDIGGLEGMLHISELGHSRVEDPSEVLTVGQELDVAVLRIEKTDNPKRPEKISLSLKSLAQDPWDGLEERFSIGSQVDGSVVSIQPFGAFVEIAPGVEGLVHISEMGEGKRLNSPRDVVRMGQGVSVTLLAIDKTEKRISLSMDAAGRNAAQQEENEAISDYRASAKQSLGTLADLFNKK